MEGLQPVQPGSDGGMLGDVLLDLELVEAALRQQGTGDGAKRQQEQQHQRGAHRREGPPGVAHQREPGKVRHIGNVTSLTNASRTQDTKSFHSPVTSAAPTRMSSTPPKIWMPRVCRRSQPRP